MTNHRSAVGAAIACVFLLLFTAGCGGGGSDGASAITGGADISWSTTVIDNEYAGSYNDIAVDSAGNAHIAYYDSTNADLKYATNSLGSWASSTVDSAGDVGQYASIALDSDGNAHIAYYDSTNGTLKYATNSLGSWASSTVDSAGTVGQYASIAIDSAGNAHIAYYDTTNGDLKYALSSSGSWVASTIDASGKAGMYASLALDSDGRAHVAYVREDDASWWTKSYKYATDSTGTWAITVISDSSNIYALSVDSAIAVDSEGHAHIVFQNPGGYRYPMLWYYTNASGPFELVSIDEEFTGAYGTNPSLAVDREDRLHISYATYFDTVGYLTDESGTWNAHEVSGSSGDIGDTSIAVDSLGHTHICYYDSTGGELRYAMGAPISSSDSP